MWLCNPSSIGYKYTEHLCQTKANLTKKSRSSNFPPKHPPHFPAKLWRPRNLSFNIEAHVNRLHRGTETGLLCLFLEPGCRFGHKINVFVSVLEPGCRFERKINVFVSVLEPGCRFEHKINVFVSVLEPGCQFEHKCLSLKKVDSLQAK